METSRPDSRLPSPVPATPAWTGAQRRTGAAVAPQDDDTANFRRFAVQGDLPALLIDGSTSRWSLGDFNNADPQVAIVEPLGDLGHYCFHIHKGFGLGRAELCALADGFLVHFNDVTHDQPNAMTVTAPDMLRVRIASDGDGEYVSAQGDRIDLKGAGSAIVIEPAGMLPAKALFIGHSRTVTVYLHRNKLEDLYRGRIHELPPALRAFATGALRHTVARRLPLSAQLLRCLEDLHGCDLDGHGRRLFIHSKAVEILCHAFKAMEQDEDTDGVDASAQLTRGVIKAQQHLLDNFVTPPSLEDLARDVGLSRSSLCTGFRQIIGKTVFDYIGDLRMRRALSMLNERASSITQIAYAVGYSHPSSFSQAVQRRFGVTPSELRRQGFRLPPLETSAA